MSDTQDGWVNTEEDKSGTWYYYEDGEVATGWKYINGNWYYFNYPGGSMGYSKEVDGYYLGSDGKMVTDEKWVNTDPPDNYGTWYYVGAHEKVVTGWNKIGDDFHYFNYPGGSMTYENTVDGFRLDEDGKIVSGTGWLKDEYSGEWYYFSDGEMKTGWVQDGSKWYYLKADGTIATGLQDIGSNTYYFYSDGEMATGWQQDSDNIWHYFYGDGNGSMAHDYTIGGYHIDESGKMITGTGWVPSDGRWYFLKDDGSVAMDWQYINDNWYYFYQEDGYMAKDTTIDGYRLKDSGEWVPNDADSNNDQSLPQWAKDRIAKYTEQLNSAETPKEKEEQKENIEAIKRLAEGGYSEDRINTVLYALDYAYDTSGHDGYVYINKTNGSDCADFVSQCLSQAFNRTSDWYYWGVSDPKWYEEPKAKASEIEGYAEQYWKNEDTKEWVKKVDIQASASWLKPGALRNYFSDGTHGEAVTTLYSEDDILNAAKNGLIKPGYIATMGSKTVSDSHAIIITDVDTDTGKVYYSAHSNERMNRDLSNAFSQEDPEDHIYIVKPYYSDGE